MKAGMKRNKQELKELVAYCKSFGDICFGCKYLTESTINTSSCNIVNQYKGVGPYSWDSNDIEERAEEDWDNEC